MKDLFFERVKQAAVGKCIELSGLPLEILDGDGHPCPRCGGTDRFNVHREFARNGNGYCRHCLPKGSGDIIGLLAWLRRITLLEAARMLAAELRLDVSPGKKSPPVDPIDAVCRAKRIPRESLVAYGARPAGERVAVPLYGLDGKPCSKIQFGPTGKGLYDTGRPAGLALPGGRLPRPGETWVLVEGVKDAAALHSLGYSASGLPTCSMPERFAKMFADVEVVVVPDLDAPGFVGSDRTASLLAGLARSVRIARLPGKLKSTKGEDVRDVLARPDGEQAVREAIEAARPWGPDWLGSVADFGGLIEGANDWPAVEGFDRHDLPGFPVDSLPVVLRNFVSELSHATQTPPELSALLTLAVCSACIARIVEVEPRPGYREPVNLFVVVLLPPANRKSAVFSEASAPMREIERERIEEARPAVARAASERRQDEARLKKLEKQAGEKGDAESRRQASELAARLSAEPMPALPRMLVDDATPEKLTMLLESNGGRIASMSPEGGVFDLMAGRYAKSGAPNFDVYLKSHAGDDLMTDRVGRESVYVHQPAMTCAYAIQPSVIEEIGKAPAFRGRGLFARFLFVKPQSWIGDRVIAPRPVSDEAREAYRRTVRSLAAMRKRRTLRLSPEAGTLFIAWEGEVEGMLGDGGELEGIRDWGGKLVGATLRLAAVLHSVSLGEVDEIEAETIGAAIEIARFLIPHAEVVLRPLAAEENPTVEDARYLLRWIERHGRSEFTKSEAQHHGKRRFPHADDIDAALAEMVRRGFVRLRPIEPTGPGRPPSPTYEVNPSWIASLRCEKRSRNSRNPVEPEDGSSCGNIGSASGESRFEDRCSGEL